MAENPAAEAATPKKKGPGKLLLVLVLAALGGGGFMFQKNAAAKAKAAAEDWEENPIYEKVVFSMEPQTVNLADGDRYLRCLVALGFEYDPVDAAFFRENIAVSGEGGGGGHGGGGKKGGEAAKPERAPPKTEPDKAVQHLVHQLNSDDVKARLQDALISALTARTFDDLSTLEGKEALKTELVAVFSGILGEGEHGETQSATGEAHAEGATHGGDEPQGEGQHEAPEHLVQAVYLREFVMQ